MINTPRDKPVIKDLNSFYLNIERLVEHYRGELGSGCIHFVSNTAQGMMFFDETELISAVMEDRNGLVSSPEATQQIIETLQGNNFGVSVYRIDPEFIHFWTHLPNATTLYSDLSSEFTDLDRLIAKMQAEKLTGVIDVSLADKDQGGMICFCDGRVIDCTCSWEKCEPSEAPMSRVAILIEKVGEAQGAVFNVKRISLESPAGARAPASPPSSQDPEKAGRGSKPSEPSLEMVRDLLLIFQNHLEKHDKKSAAVLDKLLRKKFMDKADRYDFLDPFAAEFEFVDGSVRYTGEAPIPRVLQGVAESVKELADDLGLLYDFLLDVKPWKEKYAAETSEQDFGI